MPVRPLYDCTVLLSGSRDNSVFVPNITAAEMYVLRAIHGENESGTDPITNVKPTGKGVDRSDTQERARIGTRYNAPGKTNGIAVLNALYGVGNPLPLEYTTQAVGDPEDAPLLREEETFVELEPQEPPRPKAVLLPGDPVSSVPEPFAKKTKRESALLET